MGVHAALNPKHMHRMVACIIARSQLPVHAMCPVAAGNLVCKLVRAASDVAHVGGSGGLQLRDSRGTRGKVTKVLSVLAKSVSCRGRTALD